jgi:thiamine monophosphate synthase
MDYLKFGPISPTPLKPNTQPTTPEAPKAEPNALAESLTVKAGVVAVRQWMAAGKAKG